MPKFTCGICKKKKNCIEEVALTEIRVCESCLDKLNADTSKYECAECGARFNALASNFVDVIQYMGQKPLCYNCYSKKKIKSIQNIIQFLFKEVMLL